MTFWWNAWRNSQMSCIYYTRKNHIPFYVNSRKKMWLLTNDCLNRKIDASCDTPLSTTHPRSPLTRWCQIYVSNVIIKWYMYSEHLSSCNVEIYENLWNRLTSFPCLSYRNIILRRVPLFVDDVCTVHFTQLFWIFSISIANTPYLQGNFDFVLMLR